jgi:hypothetical protein
MRKFRWEWLLCLAVMALVIGGAVLLEPLHVRAAVPTSAVRIYPQGIDMLGFTPVYSSSSSYGNYFANDGATFLHVKNGGASTITVTVVTPLTIGGLSVSDLPITITAGSEKMFGPFNPLWFNEAAGTDKGMCSVTYSGVSTVTVAALRWK